jgi:hypothetical protein
MHPILLAHLNHSSCIPDGSEFINRRTQSHNAAKGSTRFEEKRNTYRSVYWMHVHYFFQLFCELCIRVMNVSFWQRQTHMRIYICYIYIRMSKLYWCSFLWLGAQLPQWGSLEGEAYWFNWRSRSNIFWWTFSIFKLFPRTRVRISQPFLNFLSFGSVVIELICHFP